MTNSTHGALGYSTNSELARAEQKLKAAERHRDEIQFDILDLNSGIGVKEWSIGQTDDDEERAKLRREISDIKAEILLKEEDLKEAKQNILNIEQEIRDILNGARKTSYPTGQNPSNAFNAKMPWPGADSQSGPGTPAKPPAGPVDPLDRSPFDPPAVERGVNDLWRSRNDPAPKDPLDTMPPAPPAPPAEPPKRRTLADMIGEMAELRRQDR